MKIAVTGATGFIGRHVLTELSTRIGVEVIATSRGAERPAELPGDVEYVALDIGSPPPDAYDRLGRPDVLVHLAWSGLPNYRSLHHFESELPRQYAFLRSLIEAGLPSLLVTGTCYEYGMAAGELTESMMAEPTNPYAYAKSSLRQQLGFLRTKVGFGLTWARLFYMFGEGQASTSLYSQLAAAVSRGDDSFGMSRGEQLRDFLSVEDVSRYLCELALRHSNVGIVNICSGTPASVRAFVEGILRQRDWHISLELGKYPYPSYEPMASWGNSGKLHSLLST